MAWNSRAAARLPCCPALWISEAATDSGKGNSGSSTITRRSSVTNRMPSMPPTTIRTVDFQYASAVSNDFHAPESTNAGMVKTAPAATDSPMEPMVRAMFSSRIEPPISRSSAMPITAAGYVAAMVIPALRPRYALAAPSTPVISRPSRTARKVNSRMSVFSGT